MAAPFQHAVQFYSDDTSLCRTVAEFISEGLARGEPAIVIATPAHRQAILKQVRAAGHDVPALQTDGSLVALDARETLAAFMVDGQPDTLSFRLSVGGVLEGSAARGPSVRAYGEMVDLLWKDRNPEGAIRLEILWNDLATRFSFSLLCGYAMGNFYKETATLGEHDVCRHHSHILSTDGVVRPVVAVH